MAEQTGPAEEALRSFCLQLRRLRLEAGGPSVESLARNPAIPLGRSQLYAVLNGAVKEPPPWDFVRPFVIACADYAGEHRNLVSVSVEVTHWRGVLNAVVEACDAERLDPRRGAQTDDPTASGSAATESLPPDVATFVGRQAEIAALEGEPGVPAAPAVFLISGMAGVGKPNPEIGTLVTSPIDPVRVDLHRCGAHPTHWDDVRQARNRRPGRTARYGTADCRALFNGSAGLRPTGPASRVRVTPTF